MDPKQFCDEHKIYHYEIDGQGRINTSYSVSLCDLGLEELPVKFGIVEGSFNISRNKLTNLKGCTKYIGGEFDCSDNELTSLEGCPKSIGQGFYADRNCLSDLDFIPDSMVGDFYCDNNILESGFNGVNIDFLRAFKSFKIIQDNVVNLKRLKYLMSMFDKPIKIEEIEKYYTIK